MTEASELLIQQLREMATEFAIDNKTDCKQHICWVAADRLAAAKTSVQGAPASNPSPQVRSPDATELSDLRKSVIELRDWQQAILNKCKASDGWSDLKWGGDKDGWGFVHYFIGHLNTRAITAEGMSRLQTSSRLRAEAKLAEAVEVIQFAHDGYANQDVNHVDYRVGVYQACLDFLNPDKDDVGGRP